MPNIRKTVAQLELNGSLAHNAGRYAERKNGEPRPTGHIGTAPKRLTDTEKQAWKEIVKAAPPKVLTSSDRNLVEIAAVYMAKFWAREATNSEIAQLHKFLSDMGMTPVARTKIVVPNQDTYQSELASLAAECGIVQ